MTANNSTEFLPLSSDLEPELHKTLLILSSVGLVGSFLAVMAKMFRYVIPIAWKCSMSLHDVSGLCLSLGLVLIACHVDGADKSTCHAGGFFLLFGLMDLVFSLCLMGATMIFIQNPARMSQLSTFRWGVFLAVVIPQKILTATVAALPNLPINYFDTESPFPLMCFPVRQEGEKGATFGAILVFTTWAVLGAALIFCVLNAVRFWKGPSTRVHASTPSLWQMQKMEQGRSVHRFTLLDMTLTLVAMFIVTLIVYTNNDHLHTPQWIALLSLAVVVMVHMVVALMHLVLWSSLCCETKAQRREPHHRLKQLELIMNEGAGKLRLKASWTAGKGMWRRGLLKVYGPSHIKAWAQEIVVLGLMRKSQSASVLQCLWTSNSNPYYETMTLISGDIVTSDSRLTCLELTSSGTLLQLLKTMDVPLPEPCQRTIMHDIAEGLSYLHDQNVLHRNLTSAAVYLKGSVQCLVLRAAVGDFEEAQIYGTLLTGSPNSNVSRKRFFFPDIRAYALVGVEMLSRVCEYRQQEKQPHRRTAVLVSHRSKKEALTQWKKQSHHGQGQHHYSNIPGPSGEEDESMAKHQRSVRRYDNQQVPYCAPGEAEYVLKAQKADMLSGGTGGAEFPTHNNEPNGRADRTEQVLGRHNAQKSDIDVAEEMIDQNWSIQRKTNGTSQSGQSDWRGKNWGTAQWSEQDNHFEDRYRHSQTPGVTQAKGGHLYEFPDHSVFRCPDGEGEDLGMIEEEIERGQEIRLMAKSGIHKQGGYVTSRTGDGREIFIPANYTTKKSSGNSSSGYGSCGASTITTSDYYTPSGSMVNAGYNPDGKQVHKTTSAATISSFEDDILEVLPGVADEKPRKGDQMLRELLKAKQEAKVGQLIESYEERVRKGELGANLEGIPIGVVFPKKNRHILVESASESAAIPEVDEIDPEAYAAVSSLNKERPRGGKLSSPRPKTAMAAMTQRFQRPSSRPSSAASSSFSVWNARSSLKRNKARMALRRALSGKGSRGAMTLSQERGASAKEVEMKYASRPGSAMSLTTELIDELPPEDVIRTDPETNHNLQKPNQHCHHNTGTKITVYVPDGLNVQGPASDVTTVNANVQRSKNTDENLNTARTSHIYRTSSTKTRPAPPPPPIKPQNPQKPQELLAPQTPPPQEPVPPPTAALVLPVTLPQNATLTSIGNVGKFSSFGSYDSCSSFQMNPRQGDDSFTSIEPASTSSGSTTQKGASSLREQSHVDQIESEMNNIIQGSMAVAGGAGIALPPGVRLIDSGFDSASVSSEESCLCAAAALQAVEDGSCSCPSDIYSQGTCSCACSNCLGSSQGFNNSNNNNNHNGGGGGSSLTGSQDSESWSNSNSFSSYDANMHRRMIPSKQKKRDSPGCVLAPDEQYPSPGHRRHRNKNTLYPKTVYSPKRNHRKLHHTKGHYPSSASETSSAASRRYRELMKKGVPLRVSVVSGDPDAPVEDAATPREAAQKSSLESSDKPEDSQDSNNALFKNLENSGFFNINPDGNQSFRNMGVSDTHNEEDEEEEDLYHELSTIPSLEEIIKEIPDETGQFSEESKAFLNRPESEVSVKALQAVLSRHGSATESKQIQKAELIIDRIFSQHNPSENPSRGLGLQGGLDLDESAIRELAMIPRSGVDDPVSSDIAGLLSGMDARHVRYCHNISSRVMLVSLEDLLPASPQSFDRLRVRLQRAGNLGMIGNQLLDLIRMCWLNESPPSITAIVDQLTDHVTETEL